MAQIYEPSDDSEFFAKFLEGYLSKLEGEINFLDMGTGSGILASSASKVLEKKNIMTADINPEAVKLAREAGFNSVESNLFSNINASFDIITFNAPYLPEDSREPEDSKIATTGGKKGDEISVEFLKQAKNHLNSGGKILLLVSSLTPLENINKFGPKEVARKKIHLEELIIFEFSS